MNKWGIIIIAAVVVLIGGIVAFLITRDNIGFWDIAIVVFVFLVAIAFGLFALNRWSAKKVGEQNDMIEKTKQLADIYVIDKKRDKVANANLPKAVADAMPKVYKFMKLNLVKAKIGKQIITLICEKKIYDVIQVKKNIKVELAGMYIVSVKGVKTAEEKRRDEQEKRRKEKAEIANRKLLEKKR